MQKLLEVLHGALPKMSLIASDFSYLPDVTIPGERAPLVSTKVHCVIINYKLPIQVLEMYCMKIFMFFCSEITYFDARVICSKYS